MAPANCSSDLCTEGVPVSELVYIHSKLLIADDRVSHTDGAPELD